MNKRYLFHTIIPQLQHKNAIVITGMRQVGKTTLMRQLTEAWEGKFVWYDFDNPLDLLLFENIDYNVIYKELQREAGTKSEERFLVCIDEIQNFPKITKIIKYLIDHYGVKFIVTGSSNYYLRNLFPESLSGRKFLYTLYPLSFREYLYFHDLLPENELQPNLDDAFTNHSLSTVHKRSEFYDQYMEFGGFPEVVLTKDYETKRLILRNIFASFFEKDIKVFSELKDVKELRDLILLLGSRNGNILDVTRLSSELGINRVKAYSYLEFLEGIFFLRLIPKFTHSIDRSVAGGKKVYFSDTGILNLITKTSLGQLLETTIANQLQPYGAITYYNKRNTAEIDFILNEEIALEVKQKAVEPDMRKLEKLAANLNLKKHYIVSNTPVSMDNVVYPWFF
ncbi:MAG: ATP-binding protein [Bacteroidales bacterium]|nr:MAG: ATP-binding protein [Bacteroidales bacterium]